jgi:hypothetical protein
MKKALIVVTFLLCSLACIPVSAQTGVSRGVGAPTGNCAGGNPQYVDNATGNTYSCQISGNIGTWTLVGPGSTNVTGTSPIVSSGGSTPAISCPNCSTLAPSSPGIPINNGANLYSPLNYGAKADTYSVFDAVCTNGLPQVTSASAHFLSAKIAVGQTMWTVPGGGSGNAAPSIAKTTIKSIDSDTQITANANGGASCTTGQFLVWGDDDYPFYKNNLHPVIYGNGVTNCPTVLMPSGGTMLSGGILNLPIPASCNPGLTFNAMAMIGYGITNSVLYPTPDFDPTTCTGSGKLNCFGPVSGIRQGFGIQGGGLNQTASPTTTFTVFNVASPQWFRDVSCLQWGASNSNMTSENVVTSQVFVGPNVQLAGCGNLGPIFASAATAGPYIGTYTVLEAGTFTVNSSYPGMDFFSNWIGGGSTECSNLVTGFANYFGLMTPGGAQEACDQGGNVSYTGVNNEKPYQGLSGRAALKVTSSGTARICNDIFTDSGAVEFAVSVDATSTVESCGNNVLSGLINIVPGGQWIGPEAINGSCSGTASSSTTLGLYGAGQFATPACTSTVVNLGIPARKAGTITGLNVTASHAGVSSSSGVVTVSVNNSPSVVTCTIGTGTGCQDNTHSASVNFGDIISIQFTTQGSEVLAGVKAQVILE